MHKKIQLTFIIFSHILMSQIITLNLGTIISGLLLLKNKTYDILRHLHVGKNKY